MNTKHIARETIELMKSEGIEEIRDRMIITGYLSNDNIVKELLQQCTNEFNKEITKRKDQQKTTW